MAAAAWSASARTRAICAASNASARVRERAQAPKTWSPATSGATTIERMPMSSTTRSALRGAGTTGRCGSRSVTTTARSSDRPPEHPGPGRELESADPVAAALAADAGVVGEAQVPGRRVDRGRPSRRRHRGAGRPPRRRRSAGRGPPARRRDRASSGRHGIASHRVRRQVRSTQSTQACAGDGVGGALIGREDTTGFADAGIAVRPMAATSSGRDGDRRRPGDASAGSMRASVRSVGVPCRARRRRVPRPTMPHDTDR